MLERGAATLVLALALAAVCDAFPRWPYGRHYGGAFKFSPLPHFAISSSRFTRANVGFNPAPFSFGRQGRLTDTAMEADQEPATGATEWVEVDTADKPVTFGEPADVEPPTDTEPDAAPVSSGPPAAAEETSAAAAAPEPASTSAPEPERLGSPIFFPGQQTPVETRSPDVYVPECDGVPFMALNQETGRCQFLMMRTDCPEGHWFILDHDTREASCQPLPCPENEVLLDGVCTSRDDPTICPEGMVVLTNEYGDASCDCSVKNLYWPAHDRCYPAYRRGPCNAGEYLTVGDDGVQCSENVCFRDGAVLWRATKRCHRLRDASDSPCSLGRLDVNEDTLELECIETEEFAIFDLPVVRCSKGSKLDYRGRCKRELYQKFRSSFAVSAARKKECPEGFIQGISGRCLKAAKGSKLG